MLSDAELEAYLDEALPPERMAAIEASLRGDATLTARLAATIGRRDAGVHSMAAVWRRRRLSCPTREQLGSFVLSVLDPSVEDYIRFHLESIGCRPCQASLDDLKNQHAANEQPAAAARRKRYFASSAGYLSASDG